MTPNTLDSRYQARILAEHGANIARHQLAALESLDAGLKAACESLPPTLPRDLTDAMLAALAGERLSREQRAALIQPLMTHLDGLLQDTVPLPRRLAVVGAEA